MIDNQSKFSASSSLMAIDRVQVLLVGLPLFLFCTDLINLFSPPPPKPPHHHHHHDRHPIPPQTLDFPLPKPSSGLGVGNTVGINFCSSCSFRGTAVTMKKMLDASFPGLDVILANHPPPLPKRLLAKLVPIVQVGVVGIVIAGEQVFPVLGFLVPPPWYYSLRANRFGTIATTLLLGNFIQSFLQSSGAFEVYFNDELVFSKLREHRFPGEIELKEIIGRKLHDSVITGNTGRVWS